MGRTYKKISFKNAYVGLSSKQEFNKVLEQIKYKLEELHIRKVWFNNIEVPSIYYAINQIREMPIHEVIESNLELELV